MYHFGSCGEIRQDPNIVCKERRSKFVVQNKNHKKILKVQVDHCLKIQGKKCDWLIIDIQNNNAYFVELKGCELKVAILQLGDSINLISVPENGFIKREFSQKHAFAVLTRSPKDSAALRGIKMAFRKKYNTTLTIKNKEVEVQL